MKGSLGLIETRGWIPAITAADAGLKAANVVLVDCTLTWPALMTITFRGDVASVRAAVASGRMAAQAVGEVVSTHVIARPLNDLGQTTPAPFSGQEEQQTSGQQKTMVSPPAGAQKKALTPRRKTTAKKAAPATRKKTPARKAAPKTATPQNAAEKKRPVRQKRQPAKPIQKKTGDVEVPTHDTHATDKKVAQEATAAVQGTTTSAAETGGKTQKTLSSQAAPKKAAARKRTVAGNRKRSTRKRPAPAQKAGSKPVETGQKKDSPEVSPAEQDDTKAKE